MEYLLPLEIKYVDLSSVLCGVHWSTIHQIEGYYVWKGLEESGVYISHILILRQHFSQFCVICKILLQYGEVIALVDFWRFVLNVNFLVLLHLIMFALCGFVVDGVLC